jgi:hypothetical protein
VRDYYGIVMDSEKFKDVIRRLDKIRKGEAKAFADSEEEAKGFMEEWNLLDPREFPSEQVNL